MCWILLCQDFSAATLFVPKKKFFSQFMFVFVACCDFSSQTKRGWQPFQFGSVLVLWPNVHLDIFAMFRLLLHQQHQQRNNFTTSFMPEGTVKL